MLDFSTPDLTPLPVLARTLLPQAPAPSTLTRWHRRGVGPADPKIRLEVVKIGRKVYTTEAAFREFFRRINTAGPAADPDRHARTDGQQAQADKLFDIQSWVRMPKKTLINGFPWLVFLVAVHWNGCEANLCFTVHVASRVAPASTSHDGFRPRVHVVLSSSRGKTNREIEHPIR